MSQRGSASVEQVGILALVAALVAIGIWAVSRGAPERPRELAAAIALKHRCAVRHPRPCWRDPLTAAYGRRLAGAVRGLAPPPHAVAGPDGSRLVGVDYRRCRRPSCATPLPGPRGERLTLSNRRTVAFTSVREESGGGALIDYWIYRPSMAWELVTRRPSKADVDALAATPLTEDLNPKLIPLETRIGRDEDRFSAIEEPPWRHRVRSRIGEER